MRQFHKVVLTLCVLAGCLTSGKSRSGTSWRNEEGFLAGIQPQACAALSFSSVTTVIPAQPVSIAVADFNRDGVPDIAAATPNFNGIWIMLGKGNGSFQPPTALALGSFPSSVAAGDLNGDGNPDLVVAEEGSRKVAVLLGRGDGSFEPEVGCFVSSSPSFVKLADFNHDGKLDLAVPSRFSDRVAILLGNGDGTFQAPNYFDCWSASVSIGTGDFDGDGNLDLAIANGGQFSSGTVAILLGNGDGTFRQPYTFEFDGPPNSIVVADFNGDGKADLAVTDGAGVISVRLGKGNGDFLPATRYVTHNDPEFILAADFDGDGKPDLAVANHASSSVSVLLGNGDGTFQPARNYFADSGPIALAVADFDGEGRVDLAVANLYASTVSVLLNRCLSCSAIALTPNSLPPGTVGVPYSQSLSAQGGASPYTFSITSGSLRSGLALSAAGVITGIPTTPGTFSFTVTASDSQGCTGSQTYTIIIPTPPGYSLPSFITGPTYPAGDRPTSMVFGDFNKDGIPDVAVANYASNNISVLLGKGDGTFLPQTLYAVDSHPISIAVADFNGDGNLDLAVANNDAGDVSILLGKGDGSFQTPVNYFCGPLPRAVAIGDFNGDGKTDLVFAETQLNGNNGAVSVMLGNGDGTFLAPVFYGAGVGPYSVAVGDLNRDGKADLVVANNNSGQIAVLLGNGDGSLLSPTYIPSGAGHIQSAMLADLNRDGRLDVIATDFFSNAVIVLLGNGDGTFQPPVTYYLDSPPYHVAVGDINGDGRPDLVVANSYITVLQGNGDGTFQKPIVFGNGRAIDVALADLNQDGRLDIAFLSSNQGVTILLGKGSGDFIGEHVYGSGNGSSHVTVNDFNQDGIPDIAFTNSQLKNISIYLGRGDGTFVFKQNLEAGQSPGSILSADLNGDGRLDLAVVDLQLNQVSVYLGNGDGTFSRSGDFPAGNVPADLVAADFNGDGKLDLAVADSGSDQIAVLFGNGNGLFQNPIFFFSGGGTSQSLAVGDFNQDGRPDLAIANRGSNSSTGVNNPPSVAVLLADGKGGFQDAVGYSSPTGVFPNSVVVGDFDGDGILDIASVEYDSSSVYEFIGRGDGTFNLPSVVALDRAGSSITAADLNGDGRLDLLTGNQNGVSVLLGLGNGVFMDPINYLEGASQIVVQDLNGDGQPDLVLANGAVTVILGSCASCTSVRVSPATLPAGKFGSPYDQQLAATGGAPPVTFALTGGNLTPGLSLSSSGKISGVPSLSGNFTFCVTATDAQGFFHTQTYTLFVEPVQGASSFAISLGGGGASVNSTLGQTQAVHVGYAQVNVDSGSPPYGTAIYSFSQNGVVVNETGVPTSPPTTAALIYIDNDWWTGKNTGIALVNPNPLAAHLSLQLIDPNGFVLGSGLGTLNPLQHKAVLSTEIKKIAPDFSNADWLYAKSWGTLKITSDLPVSILALHLEQNFRGETLITTIPVTDLTKTPSVPGIYFSQFVDGGGYQSRVILINTSDTTETVLFRVFDDHGGTLPVHAINMGPLPISGTYLTIFPGGMFILDTDGSPSQTNTGSVIISPYGPSGMPVAAEIISYKPGGRLMTQTGVPPANPTTHARVFVDRSNGHNTGLAMTNIAGDRDLHLSLNAYQVDGVTMAASGGVNLPPVGHLAAFADELLPSLPKDFIGVLDISCESCPFPMFVPLTLRSLVNSRGDVLMTIFPVADLTHPAPSPIIFPQIGDGGGYLTEFILIGSENSASATIILLDDSGSPLAVGTPPH